MGIDYERYMVAADGSITPRPQFVIGLDLGQAIDPSALVILEQLGTGSESVFHCRHAQRFPLGTSYPQIVKDVFSICETAPLPTARSVDLAIDATGCGRPVYDLFARARIRARLTGIIITGGDQVVRDGGFAKVPKAHLVSRVQAHLQSGKLKFAQDLPDFEVLKAELQNFQVHISDSGFDSYGARQGAHDDLVLALAIALWQGCNRQEWAVREFLR